MRVYRQQPLLRFAPLASRCLLRFVSVINPVTASILSLVNQFASIVPGFSFHFGNPFPSIRDADFVPFVNRSRFRLHFLFPPFSFRLLPSDGSSSLRFVPFRRLPVLLSFRFLPSFIPFRFSSLRLQSIGGSGIFGREILHIARKKVADRLERFATGMATQACSSFGDSRRMRLPAGERD
jgi:hypothetical protein